MSKSNQSSKSSSKWDRLSTRKNMAEWREKKREEIARESRDKGKEYKFGSFGSPIFMCVGDPYVDKGKRMQNSSRGGAGFHSLGKSVGGTFQKFTSVAASSEYLDPYEMRKRKAKAQMAKNLHQPFRPCGNKKPDKTLYLSEHDGQTKQEDIIKLLQHRRKGKNKKKMEFKPRNIQTNPMAKGGFGVANTHIPAYGKATRSILEYEPSEYNAEYQLQLAEKRRHREIVGNQQPFIARISKRGQTTFSASKEVYGKPKQQQIIRRPKASKPQRHVQHPTPFRPSNPGKVGKNADMQMTFGKYPAYIDDPPETNVYDARHLAGSTNEQPIPWMPNNQSSTFTSSSLAMSPSDSRRLVNERMSRD